MRFGFGSVARSHGSSAACGGCGSVYGRHGKCAAGFIGAGDGGRGVLADACPGWAGASGPGGCKIDGEKGQSGPRDCGCGRGVECRLDCCTFSTACAFPTMAPHDGGEGSAMGELSGAGAAISVKREASGQWKTGQKVKDHSDGYCVRDCLFEVQLLQR